MGAIGDRLLDVEGQQRQSQDARRIAGAGDALVAGDLFNAILFALGQPVVPAVGPHEGVDKRDIRFCIA